MRANCHSLAVSKLGTTPEGEMVVLIIRAMVHIHDASQLFIANDKHLEILPAAKMSISTTVVESSHTRNKLLDSTLLLVSSHYSNPITTYPFVELGFPVLRSHENY